MYFLTRQKPKRPRGWRPPVATPGPYCPRRNDAKHRFARVFGAAPPDGRLRPGTPARDRAGRLHLRCQVCGYHVVSN